MPKTNFTDRMIAGLKPKRLMIEYWDAKTPGFGLRVSPEGKKTWFVMYRLAGVRRRLRLGHYPTVSLEAARKNAREALLRVTDGIDPAQEKKEQLLAMEQERRCAKNFAQLSQVYLAEHATRAMRDKTVVEYRRIIEKLLVPEFGNLDARQLLPSEIRSFLRSLAKTRPVLANRTRAVLGAIFKWAIKEDLLIENPVSGISGPGGAEKPKERVLTDDELRSFWNVRDSSVAMEVLRLILLTGQRPGEVMGMAWKELDFGQALWELPRDRTKNGKAHAVALSPQALEILQRQQESLELQRRKREKRGDPVIDSPYVFPNRHVSKQANAPMQMLRKTVYRITEAAGIAPFSPHDLRRTCATRLGRLEVPGHIIDRILNHALKGETNRVYNRYTYLKEQREALNIWGDCLIGIVNAPAVTV